MEDRADVRDLVVSRRTKITPDRPGCLTSANAACRGRAAAKSPPTLAGVTIEYYSKVERGAIAGVSASALDALARALQLDDAERVHLFHLAHAADGTSAGMRRRRPSKR
jgi:hypothetical protein